MSKTLWRAFLGGLLLLVPAWATFLILSTLFQTLDQLLADVSGSNTALNIPGLGLLVLALLVLLTGIIATQMVGHQIIALGERRIEMIPLVRSIYVTIKGMTDLFNFRSRFGRSTVVAFPFPRDGVWALGFVMGSAPRALQIVPTTSLLMVFVPTAIHPFTGYLAFVPQEQIRPISLPPEEAMKMEFSAGLYKPQRGWLRAPESAP
ncbi:MAG TPA: DUF502 domain-containing protein [Nitrospira sp.]|nr:DUF502 domain-containing protein [Nitrospira sp.]